MRVGEHATCGCNNMKRNGFGECDEKKRPQRVECLAGTGLERSLVIRCDGLREPDRCLPSTARKWHVATLRFRDHMLRALRICRRKEGWLFNTSQRLSGGTVLNAK